jgi:uncharacterized iron-regulated protein
MAMTFFARAAVICWACALSACASTLPSGAQVLSLLPTDAILLGEQHDAPEHARLALQSVQALATKGSLAALVIEMAQAPANTARLAPDADETTVQTELKWQESAWPWARYGPTVMAAVRAGVPVRGANMSRADMRLAMQDVALDLQLSPPALAAQRQAIVDGHCQLLPEGQIPGMTRIQIARDVAMARTVTQAARVGQTVLLLAGGAHVDRVLGVPLHLPAQFKSKVALAQVKPAQAATQKIAPGDLLWETPAPPPTDYCAKLREQLGLLR